MELTSPEMETYFKNGGRTAILPLGSVEMHGPHQPIGTDSIIANGFALSIAEACDGVVLPCIDYTWAGAPDGFAGTITIEADFCQKMAEAVLLKAVRMGFKRVILLSTHNPIKLIFYFTIRNFFEKTGAPVWLLDPTEPYSDEARAIFTNESVKSKEASLLLAALSLTGKDNLYTEDEMRYPDAAPPYPDAFKSLTKLGPIGYFMQDMRQHVCPSVHVSKQKGLDYIAAQTKAVVSRMGDYDQYLKDIELQQNRGWWR